MDSDGKWEYECPQFVDFNKIDKFSPGVEAYFDKVDDEDSSIFRRVRRTSLRLANKTGGFASKIIGNSANVIASEKTSGSTNPAAGSAKPSGSSDGTVGSVEFTVFRNAANVIASEVPNKKEEEKKTELKARPIFKFVAKFNANPSAHVKDDKNKEFHKDTKKSSKLSAFPRRSSVFKGKQNAFRTRKTSVRSSKYKGKSVAVLKPITKAEFKPPINNPPQHRQPASSSQQSRQRQPAAVLVAPHIRKTITRPTTPQCLKRSIIKASTKIVKTSEQLQLEQIAKMQKKLQTHLNINKATMKKVRCPALKPLPEKREKEAALSKPMQKFNQTKNGDKNIKFRKPAFTTRAKSDISFASRAKANKTMDSNTTSNPLRLRNRSILNKSVATAACSLATSATKPNESMDSNTTSNPLRLRDSSILNKNVATAACSLAAASTSATKQNESVNSTTVHYPLNLKDGSSLNNNTATSCAVDSSLRPKLNRSVSHITPYSLRLKNKWPQNRKSVANVVEAHATTSVPFPKANSSAICMTPHVAGARETPVAEPSKNVSKLHMSASRANLSLKSLTHCHSGVIFIPKQVQKSMASLKKKTSVADENALRNATTPRKKNESVKLQRKSMFQRPVSSVLRNNSISGPFQDKTNSMSTTEYPKRTGVKRLSADHLIRIKSDKRMKNN